MISNQYGQNYDKPPHHYNVVLASFLLISMVMGEFSVISVECAACPFTAIFNFGDSNSDTGGLVAAFPSLSRPNGETTFNEPAGRFSDGRLIVDFIGTL